MDAAVAQAELLFEPRLLQRRPRLRLEAAEAVRETKEAGTWELAAARAAPILGG